MRYNLVRRELWTSGSSPAVGIIRRASRHLFKLSLRISGVTSMGCPDGHYGSRSLNERSIPNAIAFWKPAVLPGNEPPLRKDSVRPDLASKSQARGQEKRSSRGTKTDGTRFKERTKFGQVRMYSALSVTAAISGPTLIRR